LLIRYIEGIQATYDEVASTLLLYLQSIFGSQVRELYLTGQVDSPYLHIKSNPNMEFSTVYNCIDGELNTSIYELKDEICEAFGLPDSEMTFQYLPDLKQWGICLIKYSE
jgi:hypothetical protein